MELLSTVQLPRGLVMANVSTILLLKLTRLFEPKVKEGLFTRNT